MVLASLTLTVGAAVAFGALPPAALGVAVITAGHGALLATALTWAMREILPGVVAVALLGLAAAAAALHPAGAIGYLGPPAWIALLGRRRRLTRLGIGGPVAPAALLAGAAIGAFLGAHLLLSASLTLGHRARIGTLAELAGWIAYDVGANILSGEVFFRGALFNRAQRRWSFATGALLSTAACLLRYLVDPLLPRAVEITTGMFFYVSLLSVANCGLLWWSGSLAPALASSFLFFAAYRTLGGGPH